MTTPDMAGLCERLRERKAPAHSTLPDSWRDPLTLEAADTLERQAHEINRLRLALVEAGMRIETCPGADESRVKLTVQKIRAALTGEDTATLGLSGKTQTDARTRGDHD